MSSLVPRSHDVKPARLPASDYGIDHEDPRAAYSHAGLIKGLQHKIKSSLTMDRKLRGLGLPGQHPSAVLELRRCLADARLELAKYRRAATRRPAPQPVRARGRVPRRAPRRAARRVASRASSSRAGPPEGPAEPPSSPLSGGRS
jgi:hypothetical protein